MKQALILHGTNSNAQSNWLPWLPEQVGGKLQVKPDQKHCSGETDPSYTTFPLLRDMLLHD